MNILIIGAAGMIGQKLAKRLCSHGLLNGIAITQLSLVDAIKPIAPVCDSITVTTQVQDLCAPDVAKSLVSLRPDVIFHLAAIVSGEAELDMRKGYRINLDGTRYLLEAIRDEHDIDGYSPKLIFTSSIAVYGAPFDETISDDFHLTPLTSYGTQKAMCELLLADYNRRGIVQGIGLRLPTICVRPGKPNAAASGFFSGIVREPINEEIAILPVVDTVRHWFASPRTAIRFLEHAATLSPDQVGLRCNMNLPGLCVSVAEQIESLRNVIGAEAVARIRREPDDRIAAIVAGWPEQFEASRARALGFRAEHSFDEIIKVYLEDDWQKT